MAYVSDLASNTRSMEFKGQSVSLSGVDRRETVLREEETDDKSLIQYADDENVSTR